MEWWVWTGATVGVVIGSVRNGFRAMPRIASVIVSAAIAVTVGAFAVATPARAECSLFPVPPATDGARSAREIVVGTVVENVGGQLYDFRLRIDHVLRGPAAVGDIRRLNFFQYGSLPDAQQGDSPCLALPGWEGDVIALAIDALAPDGKTRYNAASWLSGDPLHRDGVPRTTLAELRSLAALPSTDASESHPRVRSASEAAIPISALVAGLAAACIFVVRRRQRHDAE